ncbi:MAG TPA: hypothetical protein VGX03_33920 [Candidatus Binatia bacterium]|nr:hypothetical protein [Candidatus Binatia bacterium]
MRICSRSMDVFAVLLVIINVALMVALYVEHRGVFDIDDEDRLESAHTLAAPRFRATRRGVSDTNSLSA